ncbi:protein of unknown function [Candidatus Promineifilum breve]|uniref:Uncharacterized protein n=1 Tax=Candidatus Promineifilum breve TaxID=1806508 RepID=A0A160T5Z3_9CHLR|nr:hypothetical protein [Candidatus Promineifilum breve]CUS05394.2 protein of unknown function [Candidatus Promineifilum breve]
MIYDVQSFNVPTNGTRYELMADISEGSGRTLLLFVHTVRTAVNEAAISVGEGWHEIATATATSANRRYTAGVWAMPEPGVGGQKSAWPIFIETSRPVAGLVAFLCVTDEPVVRGLSVVGGQESAQLLKLAGPFAGTVLYAAQARRGPSQGITPGVGVVLAHAATVEADSTTVVAAALMGAINVAGVVATSAARLPLMVAVELGAAEPEEPPPPPTRPVEVSVIVRDIPAGGSHEVRHVRPGEIVMGPGGIDWEQTPYTAYILFRGENA